MIYLPDEIMDLIVVYSINEIPKKNHDHPHQFLIKNYNINPWRYINQLFLTKYSKNPPPTFIQIPICNIS